MLEALLPFVAPNMKLPLAILIKYQEFTRMLSVFRNPRAMQEYGLYGGEFSMQSLFQQFSNCPNPSIAKELKQMQQMMHAMEMAQMMQEFQKDMPMDMMGDLFGEFSQESSEQTMSTADFEQNTSADNSEPETSTVVSEQMQIEEAEDFWKNLIHGSNPSTSPLDNQDLLSMIDDIIENNPESSS